MIPGILFPLALHRYRRRWQRLFGLVAPHCSNFHASASRSRVLSSFQAAYVQCLIASTSFLAAF